jgi:hypothetical protein
MLHDFLTANRQELIDRCRSKVLDRSSAYRPVHELEYGITVFLDQLIRTLQIEQTLTPSDSRLVSGPSGGGNLDLSEMGTSAAHHGRELMQQGVGIDQVVHDYGDLCQAITDMAFELGAPIDVDEFRTLNRCLDNAIAGAVRSTPISASGCFRTREPRRSTNDWDFSLTSCATTSTRRRSPFPQ